MRSCSAASVRAADASVRARACSSATRAASAPMRARRGRIVRDQDRRADRHRDGADRRDGARDAIAGGHRVIPRPRPSSRTGRRRSSARSTGSPSAPRAFFSIAPYGQAFAQSPQSSSLSGVMVTPRGPAASTRRAARRRGRGSGSTAARRTCPSRGSRRRSPSCARSLSRRKKPTNGSKRQITKSRAIAGCIASRIASAEIDVLQQPERAVEPPRHLDRLQHHQFLDRARAGRRRRRTPGRRTAPRPAAGRRSR